MEAIITLIGDSYKWIFSGIGVFIFGLIVNKNKVKMTNWWKAKNVKVTGNNNTVSIGNNNSNINSHETHSEEDQIEILKRKIQILFIDDQEFGKDILQSNGWVLADHINDIDNIGDPNILKANIIFVDIRGVGKKLFPQEEGKGLAIELKRRYKDKKIVLYSAEDPESLVDAHTKVDFILRKAAEPMQYITLVEDLAQQIRL